ncbi:MAG TPA: metalloregulator ArsR/SmtB family transcription factor [Acidimicrobiales bacterium]|nr:metalloregulator ArsR/SmtB family transcription factor [Acidimicrobiales bacterium]
MAPTPTTTDAFNAIADPGRRQLLEALRDGEASVGQLTAALGMRQPQVSKHLAVLRAVGLVAVRADGRHRWYRLNGTALRSVHDWIGGFARTWNDRLDRLDDLVAEL